MKGTIKLGVIYKITNLKNGKVYIGQTSRTLEVRKNEHLKSYSIKDTKLYRAMRKYGQENFLFEELENDIPPEELSKKEVEYIVKYSSYNNGYNSTLGGEGTRTADYKLIIEEYEKGYNLQEISNKTGYSTYTCANALKTYGITNDYKGPGRCLPKEEKDKLIFLRQEKNMTIKEISKITGHAESTISKILKTYQVFKNKEIESHHSTVKLSFNNMDFNSITELAKYLIEHEPKFFGKNINTVRKGISGSIKRKKKYYGYQFY